MAELTIVEAADRLGVTVQQARRLLSSGGIEGRQLSNRMWLVDSGSVARYQLVRVGRGRQLAVGTAWALLWELSGLRVDWLVPRTLARVRGRIRREPAELLARAVASRTRGHRFVSANSDKAQAGLIATGRVAAGTLSGDLMDDRRHVAGYVREGSVADYADAHFMLPDSSGLDVVYENTLPVPFDGDVMPVAVVAADLSVSTDGRERAAGLEALEEMRKLWLASH